MMVNMDTKLTLLSDFVITIIFPLAQNGNTSMKSYDHSRSLHVDCLIYRVPVIAYKLIGLF